jgi:outer membrane protein OmpA-like peptidoglycan-associated protein
MGGHAESGPVESAAVLDRPESRGFWNVAWPLAMLALLALMIVHACVPRAAETPRPFDAAAATKAANDKAAAALSAVSKDAPPAEVLPLLNLIVVNFASGSAAVPADAEPVLRLAAQVLTALPAGARIAVVGHTDNTGTAAGNEALSLQRAQAVKTALTSFGAAADRLQVAGMGDARPIATNATDAGRFANRRIEFAEAQR